MKQKMQHEKPNTQKALNYEIRIRIISNHGNQNFVTSSEIDILDENQVSLTNVSVGINDQNEDEEAKKLINQQIIKSNVKETWVHSWPLSANEDLDIVFSLRSSAKPVYVRFFPSSFIPDANIKEVSILLNREVAYSGSISSSFCTIATLFYDKSKFTTNLEMYIKGDTPGSHYILRDEHGILPFEKTTSVSISVIEGYTENNTFGIRKIAFFDTNGERISYDQFDVSLVNISTISKPKNMFRDKPTEITDEPWQGTFHENNEIVVNFKKATPIAAIGILMPSIITTEVEIGAKKLMIKVNGLLQWVGKFSADNFSCDMKNSNRSKIVYLTNHRETRKNIPMYFD